MNKNKKVNDLELFDNILLNVVSSTEYTGMFYRPPMDEGDTENYSDIYDGPEQTVTVLDETA